MFSVVSVCLQGDPCDRSHVPPSPDLFKLVHLAIAEIQDFQEEAPTQGIKLMPKTARKGNNLD